MKAFVVVDMQEAYIGEKSKYRFSNKKELIDCINHRINDVKKHTVVIYVKNKKMGKVSDFVKGLNVVSNLVFVKEKGTCFSSKEFTDYLCCKDVNEIEIAGIDGDVCVKNTCIDGVKKGFKITVSLSCIGAINKERFQKTRQILSESGVRIIK